MPQAMSLSLITPELAHGTRLHLVQGERQTPMPCLHRNKNSWKTWTKHCSSSRAIHARRQRMQLRKGLLPCSSPTAQPIIACTSLWLPNVTGAWLGKGCPDAAGKLMDAANGCNGA